MLVFSYSPSQLIAPIKSEFAYSSSNTSQCRADESAAHDDFTSWVISTPSICTMSFSYHEGEWRKGVDPNTGTPSCKGAEQFFFGGAVPLSRMNNGRLDTQMNVFTGTTCSGGPSTWRLYQPRQFTRYCPVGYDFYYPPNTQLPAVPYCMRKEGSIPEKNGSGPCNETNPIHTASGVKLQTEVDYRSSTDEFSFKRYYDSDGFITANDLGINWLHNFSHKILIAEAEGLITAVVIKGGEGAQYFNRQDDGSWLSDPDITSVFRTLNDDQNNPIGYQLTTRNDEVETYNINGQLTSIKYRAGLSIVLTYDSDKLVAVTDSRNRQLSFSYDDNGRIKSVVNPEGKVFNYNYDENSNLSSVVYPDITEGNPDDNPTRVYQYSDSRFPHALTGIADENGSIYASWSYDTWGRAVSSEHSGGADRATLVFNNNNSTTITNSLGKKTTYHYEVIHGVYKITRVEGHQTASCAGANKNYTYDANGFLASKTDWNGNVTTYVHDTKGRETSRIEATGTPEAKTITTEWHADFNLPVSITEPGKITEFNYDTQGRLLSKSERSL